MPISRQETGLSLSRATESNAAVAAAAAAGASVLVSCKGTCHCGRNRFEAAVPELKSAVSCDCSLCHKSGYLWAFPEPGNVEYTRGTTDTLGSFENESLSHEVGCSTRVALVLYFFSFFFCCFTDLQITVLHLLWNGALWNS